MCTNCENETENLGCNDCDKCGGNHIDCSCITYDGPDLDILEIVAGMQFCDIVQIINNYFYTINQTIQEITVDEGTIEVSRAAGVPSQAPASGEPIIYINETTGDIYTWDGTQWVLRGTASITSAADTFVDGVALANIGSQIQVTNNGDGSKTLKTIHSSGTWTILGPASSGIDSGISGVEPSFRLRWDGRMEFDGTFGFTSPYNLLAPGASRTINLSTIPSDYKPLNFKKFPANLVITAASGIISFPGEITIHKTSGLMYFTVLGCGNLYSEGEGTNDCATSFEAFTEVSDFPNNTGDLVSATIYINHLHYYIN